jgi:Zn-dependent peptidase ImmA (M78 family)
VPRAYVTPSALRWARESIGFKIEEVADRVGVTPEKLEAAERGEAYLTLREAENSARLYERPLAALFLPEPPVEEPPEAQFRRLPGAPEPPWPPQMRALARRVRARQEAAMELYDLLEEEPPWPLLDIAYDQDPARLAAAARDALGVTIDEQKRWRDRGGYEPLRKWIDAIEALGVLVLQDSSLPVDEMRGFASTDAFVPAIVVNTNDDPRARAFTAVHEFGHLLRARGGVALEPQVDAERWCNDFASGILMPAERFAADFRRSAESDLLRLVDALALDYGVTPHAAAVRTARLRLAPQDEVDAVVEVISARSAARQPSERSGGDYYSTMVGRLSPSFVQLVFAAVDRQEVTYPVAAGLLGVKVARFEKLRERVSQRGR